MPDMDADGSVFWFEYAVRRPVAGNAVGPLSRHEAERLAAEIGGTVIRRRISQGLWSIA
ncbi:hypothetical protein [Microbacterium sp. NPDC096154]|uniref:hypothetical protein n=1 Tax=Microbacterium sp. NPDC096154 TaxID=3155549 RepID=UPI003321D14C